MSEKIQPSHLERSAFIYVRQSTAHQVRHHGESRRRQYELADRARGLGFLEVVVLDEDQGRSGSGDEERPGFSRLLTSVCQGEVGAVLALEASRLARNNRDWHHLIDLCALTDTLVIDHDGIYDPRQLNDRLLLGLKGTMSEFELGLIRQRGQEALQQMIARGEVLTVLPAGYVRTKDNRCEITPDRQVQAAVQAVFAKFREFGSARQVLLWYRQEEVPLPCVVQGSAGHEVTWKLPGYSRIIATLTNPTYAGAFVHGRRCTRTIVVNGRARRTSGHEVPRDKWPVVIRDHHVGYISWDEYQHNRDLLEANVHMKGRMNRGAAKKGPALLAGLLRCARCGRMLHVSYCGNGGRVTRYSCQGGNINHGGNRCINFGGLRLEAALIAKVLEALQPAGIEAALRAEQDAERREDEKRRSLTLALEKARYEAERARRQYDRVEPENRLVAGELEVRWNETLRMAGESEARLKHLGSSSSAGLTDEERDCLLALGQDLEATWNDPAAPAALKKRILRTVIEEIVCDVFEDPPRISLTLHWAGGVHSSFVVPKNRSGHHSRCTDREVVDLVRELAKVCHDDAIASILNRLGYRTGAGNTWTLARVRSMRSHHRIACVGVAAERAWVTMEQAASLLRISPSSVRRLLVREILPGRQVVTHAPWVIERSSLDQPAVRAAAESIRKGRRLPLSSPEQQRLPLPSTR